MEATAYGPTAVSQPAADVGPRRTWCHHGQPHAAAVVAVQVAGARRRDDHDDGAGERQQQRGPGGDAGWHPSACPDDERDDQARQPDRITQPQAQFRGGYRPGRRGARPGQTPGPLAWPAPGWLRAFHPPARAWRATAARRPARSPRPGRAAGPACRPCHRARRRPPAGRQQPEQPGQPGTDWCRSADIRAGSMVPVMASRLMAMATIMVPRSRHRCEPGPSIGPQQPHGHGEKRGLARSVRPDQAQERFRLDVQVHVADGQVRVERLRRPRMASAGVSVTGLDMAHRAGELAAVMTYRPVRRRSRGARPGRPC